MRVPKAVLDVCDGLAVEAEFGGRAIERGTVLNTDEARDLLEACAEWVADQPDARVSAAARRIARVFGLDWQLFRW